MKELEVFCRQVRARSVEHQAAMQALRSLPGQMVAVLRQELDSLVRVVFILSQEDRGYRRRLIADSVAGAKWTHAESRRPITDREMVELADKLHGWTKSVYSFGCAFIHLSNLHDYQVRDPMDEIDGAERVAILSHLRYYHGGPIEESPKFSDVAPLIPSVLQKISSNLERYVIELEMAATSDDDAV